VANFLSVLFDGFVAYNFEQIVRNVVAATVNDSKNILDDERKFISSVSMYQNLGKGNLALLFGSVLLSKRVLQILIGLCKIWLRNFFSCG